MGNSLLNKIILHAYKTVPYYSDTYKDAGLLADEISDYDDLTKVPILSKDMIQKSPDSFLSEDYQYYPQSNDLTILRTSGSTGRMLKVYWSKYDLVRSFYHLWNIRSSIYNIYPDQKFCSFHSNVYSDNKKIDFLDTMLMGNGLNLSFSKLMLDSSKLESFYEKITEFAPVWFLATPSAAYILAKYMLDNDLKPPATLAYIELVGEFVLDNYRKIISEAFKTKVVSMYGCIEANGMAIECPNGHLHCLTNNALIETLKDGQRVKDGEEGEIYITSLTNKAMPIIRYALGDRGILYPSEICSCGNRNPVIKILAGRIMEYITIRDKAPINCSIFSHAVENINAQLGYPILQFQVVQEDYEKFAVLIVLGKNHFGWKETISKHFINEMKKIGISNANWEFNFSDKISPNPATGKLRFFVNNLKNNC